MQPYILGLFFVSLFGNCKVPNRIQKLVILQLCDLCASREALFVHSLVPHSTTNGHYALNLAVMKLIKLIIHGQNRFQILFVKTL